MTAGSSSDADSLFIDVDPHGTLTMTHTTGRDLNVAVNGEWAVAPDRERIEVGWTGGHRRPDCCSQTAVADLDRLAGWLAVNLPGVARDGERPADTAIRILGAFHLVITTAVSLVVSEVVAPAVGLLRQHGVDAIPNGLTIPAKEKTPTMTTTQPTADTTIQPEALPRIGERVHYRAYGTPAGEYKSVCRTAEVTVVGGWRTVTANAPELPGATRSQVWDPSTLSLEVSNQSGLYFNDCPRGLPAWSEGYDAPNVPSYEGGTWHPAHECDPTSEPLTAWSTLTKLASALSELRDVTRDKDRLAGEMRRLGSFLTDRYAGAFPLHGTSTDWAIHILSERWTGNAEDLAVARARLMRLTEWLADNVPLSQLRGHEDGVDTAIRLLSERTKPDTGADVEDRAVAPARHQHPDPRMQMSGQGCV